MHCTLRRGSQAAQAQGRSGSGAGDARVVEEPFECVERVGVKSDCPRSELAVISGRNRHSLASNVGGFVWAEVGEEDLPLVASQVVLVLRPRGSVPAIKRDFVLRYLRSRHATELFEGSSMGSVARLTRSSMSEMNVPVPDASLEQALAEVAGARDQFATWSEEAELLLDSVFDEDDAEVARQRLLRDSRLIRWRIEAAHSIETIEGQVRNQFPYPVSLRWRVAESQLSAGVDRDAYTSLLGAAEQLLAYVASVGLAVAHAAGLRLAAVDAIRKKLDSGQGPALGDWVAVIDELGGRSSNHLANTSVPTTLKTSAATRHSVHPCGGCRVVGMTRHTTDVRTRLTCRLDVRTHGLISWCC